MRIPDDVFETRCRYCVHGHPENNNQETGISRYLNEYNNAEELADALALSLDAADEHLALVNLRGELCNLADRAEQILQMPINDNEKIKLCKSVISLAVTCARYKRRLDHAAD